MVVKKLLSVLGFLVIGTSSLLSQSVVTPNYALKSHETLEIKKIEATQTSTVFYMSIENRIEGGTFCADKNVFIIYPDGTRNKLGSSTGIPVCPDSYKFKYIGEKLNFILTFPPLKTGNESIDLVEECNENCFSFFGIILNSDMNKKIDDVFALAEKREQNKALNGFIEIADNTIKKSTGYEALLYINIIKLAEETGNTVKSAEWYNRLKSSGIPQLQEYIEYLNKQGIRY